MKESSKSSLKAETAEKVKNKVAFNFDFLEPVSNKAIKTEPKIKIEHDGKKSFFIKRLENSENASHDSDGEGSNFVSTPRQSSESESKASTVVECICNGKVTDNTEVIACDMCDKWHHRKCSGLLVRQFRFFDQYQEFKWFCPACQEAVKHNKQKLESFLARRSQGHVPANIETESKRLDRIYKRVQNETQSFRNIVEPQIFALIPEEAKAG